MLKILILFCSMQALVAANFEYGTATVITMLQSNQEGGKALLTIRFDDKNGQSAFAQIKGNYNSKSLGEDWSVIVGSSLAIFCEKVNGKFSYKKEGLSSSDQDNVIFSVLGSVGWEYVTEKEEDKVKSEGLSTSKRRVIFRRQIQ